MWSLLIQWLRMRLGIPEIPCKGCEVLERELEIERARFNLLLDRLKSNPTPSEPIQSDDTEELKPIRTTRRRFVPFAVRQQMAEANDALTLKTLQDKYAEIHRIEHTPSTNDTESKTNEELENEILNHAG